jgi:hypothetical protein
VIVTAGVAIPFIFWIVAIIVIAGVIIAITIVGIAMTIRGVTVAIISIATGLMTTPGIRRPSGRNIQNLTGVNVVGIV